MEKMQGMGGFFVALVTPFDRENRLNEDALCAIIERTLSQGASGMLLGGSSGECFLMSHEERVRGFEVAAQFKGRTRLMASCAAISTDEAIDYARRAAALGYDALVSTVPFYYKFGMENVARYFRDIREAVDLPLFLYNFPGNTGVEIDFSHPEVRRMMTDGTIAGVKQTSLNLHQIERLKTLNPNLVIYGGYDEVYLGARILGADGAIGSTFNFTLPLFTKIEEAYARRDIEAAQGLQTRANHIMEALVTCSLFPSIKHILNVQGIDAGECRRPFPRLTDAQKAHVEKVVAQNL